MAGPRELEADEAAARLEVGEPSEADPEVEPAVEPSFFADRRRLAQTSIVIVVLIAAIYVLLPKLVGLEDALATLDDGKPVWLALAFACSILTYLSYIALFRGVVGERIDLHWRESYEITMAGLAASRLFSAGGAGGIILTYWALRKAGMAPRQSACRMVALLVLLYAVYLLALVIFGVLLRAGALPGEAPIGLTIVPAGLAGAVLVLFLLIALIPEDFERRFAGWSAGYRFGRVARRLATVPDTLARGTRTAINFVHVPSRGGLAVVGTLGFWATNIAILWACFKAFGVHVPFGVVIQGYFVGMVANLLPGAPGGVGTVDAGMIGAFVLFGIPGASVFAAVLMYRLFAFWLPVLPGFVAFLQLRGTVARWDRERRAGERAGVEAPASPFGAPILQKVK